eukprot:TRINITY_DN5223_c1_g1_i1.p2 TRINITY_DN5223_c1_g1~~TRINITY_DN5223_c1_g1_i1.p2  ORF type:complete len:103 (-),score=15.15 TRINITY_DN5223_c1_g1_i1:747-1055(-)
MTHRRQQTSTQQPPSNLDDDARTRRTNRDATEESERERERENNTHLSPTQPHPYPLRFQGHSFWQTTTVNIHSTARQRKTKEDRKQQPTEHKQRGEQDGIAK